MACSKPNPLLRLLPSLTDVAFLMPIVWVFLAMDGAQTLLGDGDTGWHVRTGEWILQNGRVPHQDIFSFTKAGQPWYAWEWLWDVAFAWLHQHWGMAAVVLASLLLISLTFALLFRLVRRQCGNVFIALGVTVAAAAGSSMHWLARPHLFTLLFVVLFYSILERARDGNKRLLMLLPLLTVLWTNLHGGFFVGIIMIGAYAAGELLNWLVEPNPAQRRTALARSQPYILAGAGCFLATLVNPYFYHLHLHIYQFLTEKFAMRFINEYQSISFQSPLALYFEPMVLVGMLAAGWNLYRRRFAHSILLLGWAHLGLFSVRNMPIYLIVAAPLVARTLEEWLELLKAAPVAGWIRRAVVAFQDQAAEFGAIDRIGRWHPVSAASVLLLIARFYAPAQSLPFRAEYDPKQYPEKAVEALRRAGSSARIFTHDEWGDYLIYRLYPANKVFVDGRFDLYGASFAEKYLDVMSVKHDWEDTLNRYAVDTILLPVDASLAGALKETKRWRPIYDDGIAIVFHSVAPGPGMVTKHMAERDRASAVIGNTGNNRDRKIAKSEKGV